MAKIGISVALLTPFMADLRLDEARLGAHAARVLAEGADSVTLFGTTGEGASMGVAERVQGVEAALAAGIAPDRIKLGISALSVADALDQVARGVALGVTEFLLLPHFYFTGCDEAGLYDWHAAILSEADPRARFILYHIPQVTGVPLGLGLVERLATAFPERLLAIKDSSGDWETAEALLRLDALSVLVGDERLLHRAVALGGGGAISGVANLYPARMRRLYETASEDLELSAEVNRLVSVPVIPALKVVLAAQQKEPGWERLRPPLVPLSAEARLAL